MNFGQLAEQLNLFVVPALQFNWVDIVILLVLFFYALEGFSVGFIVALVDLISFLLSFSFGLRFYGVFAASLISYFALPIGFANALGFFLAAILSEVIFSMLFRFLLRHLERLLPSQTMREPKMRLAYWQTINNIFGFLPGIASALILLSFLLTMIVSLPFSPFLKQSVSSSRMGSTLVSRAQGFENDLHSVFGGAVSETLNFLTIKPQGDEIVNLNFRTTNVRIDVKAEEEMVSMVNKERTSRGLPSLIVDPKLWELARFYAKDMFARGYFSHYTPEGVSTFDRMDRAGISYSSAGENLALAPDVSLAMQGLMRSPGHRANILSKNYGKIGIGVIDGGIYGEMFTQEFTN